MIREAPEALFGTPSTPLGLPFVEGLEDDAHVPQTFGELLFQPQVLH